MAEKPTRNLTLRLEESQAEDLERLARVEGIPMTEAIRLAINEHIKTRRKDPEFQQRIKRILKEDEAILRRLAG